MMWRPRCPILFLLHLDRVPLSVIFPEEKSREKIRSVKMTHAPLLLEVLPDPLHLLRPRSASSHPRFGASRRPATRSNPASRHKTELFQAQNRSQPSPSYPCLSRCCQAA